MQLRVPQGKLDETAGSPNGATNRVMGCAQLRGHHAKLATGAFDGAAYGATMFLTGASACEAAARTLPVGHAVELPVRQRTARGRWTEEGGGGACNACHLNLRWDSLWGHEPCEGCAEMCGGDACNLCHWSLRRGSLWGHGPCEGSAEINGGGACNLRHWNFRRNSLWGREPRVKGVPKQVAVTHAICATGAFGGAPCGATGRVRGVPK
eukprot:9495731-Pyramimonas_sp.AAC.1